MANVQTDALPSVATIAVGDTFVGNDASSGDTAQFTLPAFDARYAQLAAANVFTATNQFKAGGFNDQSIEFGSTNFGLGKYSTSYILFQTGTNAVAGAISAGGGGANNGLVMTNTGQVGWVGSGDPSNAYDTCLFRDVAAVVQVNNGTAGAGGAIRFPQTPADADAAAPATGATIYSKQVGGKNALFVRFPTGAVQQLAIEL